MKLITEYIKSFLWLAVGNFFGGVKILNIPTIMPIMLINNKIEKTYQSARIIQK